MPPKRTPNSKFSNKADITEKVKEIKQRQQNWFKQRDEHVSGGENGKSSKSLEANDRTVKSSQYEQREVLESSKKPPSMKTQTNFSHGGGRGDGRSIHGSHSKQKGFNAWLKNKQGVNDEESPLVHKDSQRSVLGESYIISKEKPKKEYVPNQVSIQEHADFKDTNFMHQANPNSSLSPEAFDQLADQIVNRVKNELSIKNKPYYANQYTDNSARSSYTSSYTAISKTSPDDVKSSLKSDSSLSGHDENNYLDGHFCPQCSQLMVGKHDPMLIIPCGHNICKACSELDDLDLCTLCSCEINSFTCNIMLKQIIGDYKRDRKRMESSRKKESARKAESQLEEKDYKEEIKTLMIRLDVLETESDNIKDTMDGIKREINSEQKQIENIEMRENKIKEEIEELNMKLDGLANHKQDYFDRSETLEQKYSKQEEKLNMVKETIRQLNRDVENIQLSGLGNN